MSEKITNNNQLDKEKLSQIQYLNKVSYHSKPFVTNAYERGHANKAMPTRLINLIFGEHQLI